MDRFGSRCTFSDESKPGGARVSAREELSIQFRRWELNRPVNLLINRAFLNVVVMGTIERALYLFDYYVLFGSVPERLPPELPPIIAAVGEP